MKSISVAQQAAVGAPAVVAVWFIELLTSPAARVCTAGFDIDWNGYTWKGAGLLGTISPVTETTATEATGLTIELSAVPVSLLSLALTTPTQGATCTVMVAWYDPDNGAIIGTPSLEAQGIVDIPTIEHDKGTARISITVETAMADFSRPNVRRYTDADHQARNPGDLFCQYVSQMAERVLVFPSAEAQR